MNYGTKEFSHHLCGWENKIGEEGADLRDKQGKRTVLWLLGCQSQEREGRIPDDSRLLNW